MREFEVTLTVSETRTYALTVKAQSEDAAGDKALQQFYRAKESTKPLPWDEADFDLNVQVEDVIEV